MSNPYKVEVMITSLHPVSTLVEFNPESSSVKIYSVKLLPGEKRLDS